MSPTGPYVCPYEIMPCNYVSTQHGAPNLPVYVACLPELSLMRYVATPVWYNETLAGILLAGGITNGKVQAIV